MLLIKAHVKLIAVLGFSVILIVMGSFFRARHHNIINIGALKLWVGFFVF